MNLLKSWFLKVINKPIMEAENKGKILGRLEFEEERKKENMKINMFEIEKHIGKNPVIVLSNEWCNPIVADIKSVVYENGVVYEVFDYITGETMFGSNTVMPFTIQKLKIVEKLTPDDICAIFFEGKFSGNEIYKKQSTLIEQQFHRTNYDDWIKKMKENGFFDKYPQYQL